MTPKEIFAKDYTIATLIGLPIILDTGCCPADVDAGMRRFGFPCLTDAGDRLVLWNGFSQRECRPWSPCSYPRDTEEWVIKDANKRNYSVVRSSLPGAKSGAIVADYSAAAIKGSCEGDTPSEATCLAYIEAFKDTLTEEQLAKIAAAINNDIEQRSWEAYLRGNSIPLKERIAQLQLEVAQQAIDAHKCQQAIALMEHGPVCALGVLESGFHITTKQVSQITFEDDDTPTGTTSVTISSTYTDISLADAIIAAGTVQHGSTGM